MAFSTRDVKLLKERFGQAQSDRSVWEGHAQDIIQYMMPFRPDILWPSTEPQGRRKMDWIFLSHAIHAGELFAAGMASRMANQAIQWFKVRTEQEGLENDHEVKGWLEAVEKLFYRVFDKSNFYTADHEAYIDDAFLGTSAIFIGSHPRMKVYYESLNIGECYPALNQYGQIDRMFRKFGITARQAEQKFGRENLSERIRGYLDGNKPDTMVELLHAVEPREDRIPGSRTREAMPWSDVYVEYDGDKVLREGGFNEFPYVVTRYYAPPGHAMGRGPGMVALPSVKELQKKRLDIMKAGEKLLDPPLLLPNEGFIGPVIKLTPGGVNFINADGSMQDKIGVFPVAGAANLGYTDEDMERTKNEISAIFFNDLMLLAMDKEMTATEFIRLAQEKMQMLGPFLGRLMTERYNPVFVRTFNILWEQGLVPPPPMILMAYGGRLRIEFVSPLAKAQKAAASQGIIQTAGFLEQVMQIDPQAADRLNIEGAVVQVAENSGWPQEFIRSDEEVAKIRKARAQAQQAQQVMAAAGEAAKVLPHLSKAPEAGSPIGQLQELLKTGAGRA
jgi:hypothetical protein